MDGNERLNELNSTILTDLTQFEERVAALTRRVEALREQLDVERRRLGSALEGLRYHALLPASSGAPEKPERARNGASALDLEAIRQEERLLGEQLLRCSAFATKLTGLSNLLAVNRGQFAPQAEAPPELDIWKLVAGIATIKAQEQERYRLAREVHDGPAQVLANSILGLELCEQIARRSPEQLIDEMSRLKATLREGLVEVRRFIFDLRPTVTERGLLTTLQRWVTEYQNVFRVGVDLRLPAAIPTLTPEQEITIFRIVQESLQNVQKHAKASHVQVHLTVDDEALRATIRDDGRGFQAHETVETMMSGVGLRGMGERAAAVGGELQVESRPGEGATIRLVLPRASQTSEARV